jgi:hypothetical protein
VFVEPGIFEVTVIAGENPDMAEFEVRPSPGCVAPEEQAALPTVGSGTTNARE